MLSTPRTDPDEPNSNIRLLPRVFDGEALVGPGMKDARLEASIERYLSALATADCQEGKLAEARSARFKDKIASLREQMRKYKALEVPYTPRWTSKFR